MGKVTSVKTHYPDVMQKFTWDVAGAMSDAGMSVEGVEKFQELLVRAYSMGRRDGYEKAERDMKHLVEIAQWYNQQNQQIDQLKEALAEVFGWKWQEEEDDCWE